MGAAQMIARVIADRASAVGDPDKLSLDKVRGALGELKQRLEGDVATRAAARARQGDGHRRRDERRARQREREGRVAVDRDRRALLPRREAQGGREQLGMAIAGLQAISALETALEHPPEKITVGGGSTPAELLDLAQRAKIKLKADQITKTGRNYTRGAPRRPGR
jgi:hypothetical protein